MGHGRKIIIEAVPASAMRYDTCGDWQFDAAGNLVITVVGVDPLAHDEAFLVALHELFEVKACMKAGISQAEVDDFDMAFQGEGEPGDAWNAPYRVQHRQAMLLEHMAAHFLGLTKYGIVE